MDLIRNNIKYERQSIWIFGNVGLNSLLSEGDNIMNTINLQKSNSYALPWMSTYSKFNLANTKTDKIFAQHLDVSEKKLVEPRKRTVSEATCQTDYMERKALFNQKEVERVLSASRIQHSSKDETCSETVLTDDQEASLRIMKILGVKLRNEVNWDSDGTGQLTAAQIKDLKARYNVWNLDTNEYCNLLVELVNLNVLSSDDLVKQFVHEIPPEVAREGCLVYSSSIPFRFSSEHDSIMECILMENEILDDLLRAIDNRKTSILESDVSSVRRFYERESKRGKRLIDTFELLKR